MRGDATSFGSNKGEVGDEASNPEYGTIPVSGALTAEYGTMLVEVTVEAVDTAVLTSYEV